MTQVPPDQASDTASLQVVPLERLVLPTHLDGSMLPKGNSTVGTQIDALNDIHAIAMWLTEVAKTEASFRSYRLEAERCLLWATIQRGKPLTGLTYEDIREYARFLLDPLPRKRWIRPGRPTRDAESWRPFRGPLSPQSCTRALGIVESLFEWLENAGYIAGNPWHGRAMGDRSINKTTTSPALELDREANVVSAVEWSYIRSAMDDMEANAEDNVATRAKVALYLAYFADLKPGEICSLRTSSITVLASSPIPVWKLNIHGRPPTVCEIILLPPVQQVLARYLDSRGIAPGSATSKADIPVIASSRGRPDWPDVEATLTGHGARSFTRQVFVHAAALAQAGGDRTAARRLLLATAQWLRHAFEVHMVQLERSRNWSWPLIGACWLASPNSRLYLAPRTPLTAEAAFVAFEDLRDMWQ